MNFVSEVINIVNENEIKDARFCLKKLVNEIQTHQGESKSYIESNYIEFSDAVENNHSYLEQAEHLSVEVDKLLESIESETKNDVLSVADDVQRYLSELEELHMGLRLNKLILQIDENFQLLKSLKDSQQYGKIRDTVNKLRELIFDSEDKEIFKHTDCYQNIKIRWHIEHETLLNTLQSRFESLVQLQEKTFQSTKCITVKISKDKDALEEIVYMLFQTNFNAQRVYSFLMQNVFEPVITRPVSLDINKSSIEKVDGKPAGEFTAFTLSFSTKQNAFGDSVNLRPGHKNVFNHLVKVFQCMQNLNVKLPNGKDFFETLADRIGEQFFKLFIEECLTHAIPDTIEDMNNSNLANEVKDFRGFLKIVSFVDSDGQADKLFEFADKIDIIFKKRFCLNILNSAVTLMRKDLHDMQIVEGSKLRGSFPRCMVSRNIFELIDLVEKVLLEANDLNGKSVESYVLNDIQDRLQSTIPMIMERYSMETISAHGKFLQTIPQQSALFHNNCLYLAWWLNKFQSDDANSHIQIERCEIIINELQEQGSKQFALQIGNQRSQLLEILNQFDLTDAMVELGPQPFKIIRQCLRQLDLLKNVWQTILPELVYNKTMGTIINDFCDEIIRKIVSREDISSEVANGLVSICEMIIERVPAVFADPHEVCIYVKHWVKLQQIKMILNASMAQIAEQWADGKGPLTLNFRAEDIRHLIRALFQNTDRRASVLATIA